MTQNIEQLLPVITQATDPETNFNGSLIETHNIGGDDIVSQSFSLRETCFNGSLIETHDIGAEDPMVIAELINTQAINCFLNECECN